MMEAGAALVTGTPDELTEQYWPGDLVLLSAEAPDQLDRVANWTGVVGYDRDPGGPARVRIDGAGRIPDLVAGLVADGVRLTRVDPHNPTLEDLYFAVRRESGHGGLAPVQPGVVPASQEKIGAVR
jgi:hypothetical protein